MNIRPARFRQSESLRRMARETNLSLDQLVLPIHICEGRGMQDPINTLPGQYLWSRDVLLEEVEHCLNSGLRNFILYPQLKEDQKDRNASLSFAANSFYIKTLRSVKEVFPEAVLIGDLSLAPYNLEGQDGLLKEGKINSVDTLAVLVKMAVAHAQAGADMIAASGMMDGQVGCLRAELNNAGFDQLPIMAYPSKFASAFYKPSRQSLNIQQKGGDRRAYQVDPANRREALKLAFQDTDMGADVLAVQPALHALDLISEFKQCGLPVAAHHSSGEFSMLMAGVEKKWIDFMPAMNETLISMKRAGADLIITFLSKAYAKFVHEQS